MYFDVSYANILGMRKHIKVLFYITTFILAAFFLQGCGKISTEYRDAGFEYLEKYEADEAIDNFLLSIEKEEESKDTLRGLGIAYIMKGQYAEGADALIKALEKSNGRIKDVDYDINYYLAYAYEKSEKYEEAVDIYSALITLKPKDTASFYHRALCYLKMNEKTKAEEDFATVTAKSNEDYDLHIQIFFSIKNSGFETDANSYLKAILEDGKRKISDYDRGRMCYYLGEYSDARVYLEKAKDLSKPDTILMLGKTYEAISDYSYAASLYASYLDKKGNNAAVYNQLGVCRWKLEDYEGALAAFTFGLKLEDPEWRKELLYNEAVTYEYMGDFKTACERMENFCKEYPKDEDAKHELLFLKTR